MRQIDIHADDYAVSVHASEDILALIRKEAVTSISIMPNMSCFEKCMGMLADAWDSFPEKPLISVHLNFMEGHCCCDRKQLPDLVDDRGYFKISWGGLLKLSYGGSSRAKVAGQLEREIKMQLERVWNAMPEGCELRVDSHQHTHMIPIVFKALMRVLDNGKYRVSFVRTAQEPILPYLKKPGLYTSYSPVNLVKNIILNLYSAGVRKALAARGIGTALLWGILMSGYMDRRRVEKLFSSMKEYSVRKGKKMEILFHPGSVLPDEITEEFVKEGFVQFHLSKGRRAEYEAAERNAAQ